MSELLTQFKAASIHYSNRQECIAAACALAAAVLIGGWLRFANLGARELSSAEGVSWAAAAAPSANDVIRLQSQLNPGKLPVYEFALRWWIHAAGDREATLRTLSATLGMIAIAEVFLLVLLLPGIGDLRTASLSALIVSANLVTVKYSREARVYPMQLAIILAQIIFLLRAQRHARVADLVMVALLTALALAAHFATAAVLLAEAVFLISVTFVSSDPSGQMRRAKVVAAVAAGVVALTPVAPMAIHASSSAIQRGVWNWIRLPPIYEPLAMFNRATGSFAFPMLAGLAGWGVVRGWAPARESMLFLLALMWAPITALTVASYVFRPMAVENYALACFLPFFILVGFGIQSLPTVTLRNAVAALIVVAAVAHVHAYDRKPHDFQYREATLFAFSQLSNREMIAVPSALDLSVVTYYAPLGDRDRLTSDSNSRSASVLIEGDTLNNHGSPFAKSFPIILTVVRGLRVRARWR